MIVNMNQSAAYFDETVQVLTFAALGNPFLFAYSLYFTLN
jgi:hypothetical protein